MIYQDSKDQESTSGSGAGWQDELSTGVGPVNSSVMILCNLDDKYICELSSLILFEMPLSSY